MELRDPSCYTYVTCNIFHKPKVSSCRFCDAWKRWGTDPRKRAEEPLDENASIEKLFIVFNHLHNSALP